MELIKEYGGADFLDLQALNVFAQFCFEKGREQGRADALDIDMYKPMHFTDEQSAWIKNYIIINGKANYERGAKEFAEWLQRNDAFIADAEFDSYKPKLFFSSVESALAEWQKEVENE